MQLFLELNLVMTKIIKNSGVYAEGDINIGSQYELCHSCSNFIHPEFTYKYCNECIEKARTHEWESGCEAISKKVSNTIKSIGKMLLIILPTLYCLCLFSFISYSYFFVGFAACLFVFIVSSSSIKKQHQKDRSDLHVWINTNYPYNIKE